MKHRSIQLEERLLLGPGYTDLDLVFCREDGGCLHQVTFKKDDISSATSSRPSVGPIKCHGLRHAWATLALRAGEHPKVVSEILGTRPSRSPWICTTTQSPGCRRRPRRRVARLFLGSEGAR